MRCVFTLKHHSHGVKQKYFIPHHVCIFSFKAEKKSTNIGTHSFVPQEQQTTQTFSGNKDDFLFSYEKSDHKTN